ncbi:MAG TPA: FMN-binding protein [Candidatus Saccharimonadales bacterium]|nr:FMN-binding protein [Candidatus Saccharimonadales bacterium]
MKKTAVIIITIALLGLIGIYEKTHASTHELVSPSQTEAATMMNKSRISSISSNTTSTVSYKDGTYTGDSESTPYGQVQIAVVINGGKITNVNFLQMPNDQRESEQRTIYSEPLLKQTAIDKQSANIDFVSGATSTSEGYQQSLQSALDQAARST